VKRAIAILFSLALIASPGAQTFAARAADKPAACPNCSCGNPDCCAAQPTSQQVPAAPQSSPTHNEGLALPALRCLVLYQLASDSSALFPTSGFFPGAADVPLYQRDCRFLI
jgi:hypothetical protein